MRRQLTERLSAYYTKEREFPKGCSFDHNDLLEHMEQHDCGIEDAVAWFVDNMQVSEAFQMLEYLKDYAKASLIEGVERMAPFLSNWNIDAFVASSILAIIFQQDKEHTLDLLTKARQKMKIKINEG